MDIYTAQNMVNNFSITMLQDLVAILKSCSSKEREIFDMVIRCILLS